MNTTKTVTIICWVITALALLSLVVWFLLSGLLGFGLGFGLVFDLDIGSFEPVGTQRVSAAGIDSLSIDWTAGTVSIGTHGGDDIQITEFARRALRDGEALSLSSDGGTLAIDFTEDTRRFSMGTHTVPTKQLEVLIPHALSANVDRLHVNTISGGVSASDMQVRDVFISTVSGRIELSGITSPQLRASTTSGRIELSAVEADDIHLHTVSGRIAVADTQAEALHTNTISGRHELSGSFGYVTAQSTSGRIEIQSRVTPERVVAQAASGRIELTVPNEGAVSVQYSTGAGNFRSEIPVITHSGADAQFHLSTASGRISIYALP